MNTAFLLMARYSRHRPPFPEQPAAVHACPTDGRQARRLEVACPCGWRVSYTAAVVASPAATVTPGNLKSVATEPAQAGGPASFLLMKRDHAMLPSTEILSMTSLEIAELVGKRHDNVKRTIDTLVNQDVIEFPQIEDIPTGTKPVRVYVFSGERGKRDSIVVVAQLSPEFTARLVDRWQELEQQITKPQKAIASDSPLEFARLILETMPNLGDSTKQVMLSKASEIAFGVPLLPLPKVDEHLMNATEVGKLLGISAQAVGRLANANGLKTAAHGEVRLDKSRHSSKMVENFFYNQAGVESLRDALGGEA